jgi:hypothetical protein
MAEQDEVGTHDLVMIFDELPPVTDVNKLG